MTQRYDFRVPGPLKSYQKDAKYSHSPAYKAFKSEVRWRANVAGVPDELLDTDSAEIWIRIFWKKAARCDTSNILKSIEDGLFKQDRRIEACHAIRHVNHGEEYAQVSITVERR